MRTLTASQILDVWERGHAAAPAERTLILLMAATGDSWDDLAALPIGVRDSRLLHLRAAIFGSRMDGVATCPACDERLELMLDVGDLLAGAAHESAESMVIHDGRFQVEARLPTTNDLLAVMSQAEARSHLIERCVVAASHDGVAIAASLLPERVIAAVAARLAEADPLAQIELALRCPACDHRWPLLFDIGAFVWAEVDALARRTLHEVHALASAYGWREPDVLALSPWRRRAYLELAQS
jgi:hypothetical protein